MTLQERTPVPILQHDAEFETLLELYRRVDADAVLEIGTFHGGTLYHWLCEAQPGTHVVSVDSYAAGVDNRALYNEWCPKHVELHVIQGDSRDPDVIGRVEQFAPFEWVFIDAGHFYPEVLADWNNYKPMCWGYGTIAFHDILTHPAHPEIEVGRLWDEIKQEHHTFEIIGDPFAEWGGIGVVLL